jgi:hypothetical protein
LLPPSAGSRHSASMTRPHRSRWGHSVSAPKSILQPTDVTLTQPPRSSWPSTRTVSAGSPGPGSVGIGSGSSRNRIGGRAEIEGFHPRALRHACAVEPRTCAPSKSILRHADSGTTTIYPGFRPRTFRKLPRSSTSDP